jgi:hypothetical protein
MVESFEEVLSLVAVAIFVTCTVGCGGDDDSAGGGDSTPKGGASASNGTSSGGTSSGGSSSGSGGMSSGGTSSGGTSGGGAGGMDCSGEFGAPRVVLEMGDTVFSSLTLTPDELELIYSAGPTGSEMPLGFYRARRASKADVFSNPVALPELDAACLTATQTRSGDLTFDGLGFYFVCYDSISSSGTLYEARRASLDAPFVLDPGTPTLVGAGGPSVSRDELELFVASGSGPGQYYVRSNTGLRFDTAEPITGFDPYFVLTPEIAPNDVDLFASVSTTGSYYTLGVATRSGPGPAFGTPRLLLPEVMNETFGSAAISNDCRSLYFVHLVTMPTVSYRVEVMSR